MKILLILTAAFDQGGTQNDMIQLSSTLKPLGYDLHLAAPEGALENQLANIGVTFHGVPSPVGGIRAQLNYTMALARIIRKGHYDILAPQSIRAALAAGLLRMVGHTRQPVVTSLHNLHNPGNAALAARILRNTCDLVTFENHYERRLVGLEETDSGHLTRVVYSGVDLGLFFPRRPRKAIAGLPQPDGKLVGCVARLSPEKDHQTLLKAWSRHTRKHHHDHLILVGDGPCRAAIETTIAQLELGTKVTLLGDRNDVERILPRLDLFILSSSRESYPRSAREALACGVPVILPAIGGCGEIVAGCDAGALFQSGSPKELARVMAEKLHGSHSEKELRLAARKHAEDNFPLEKWRDTMDRLYRSFRSSDNHLTANTKVAVQ